LFFLLLALCYRSYLESELIWCTSYDFKDITGWNRIKTHDFILFPFFIFCSILIVSVWNFLPLSLKHIWSKSYHFQDMKYFRQQFVCYHLSNCSSCVFYTFDLKNRKVFFTTAVWKMQAWYFIQPKVWNYQINSLGVGPICNPFPPCILQAVNDMQNMLIYHLSTHKRSCALFSSLYNYARPVSLHIPSSSKLHGQLKPNFRWLFIGFPLECLCLLFLRKEKHKQECVCLFYYG
jgi:hypothetical protein